MEFQTINIINCLLSINFVWFSVLGGSEAEQVEGSGVIITKRKKISKKPKSVLRGKKPKKEKSSSYKKESDQEKQEYVGRLSKEGVPQGDQNNGAESSLKEIDVNESRGALRENDIGEESGSEGNQNDSNGESSPREVKKSPIESASPDSAKIAEISDDEPLVNYSSFVESPRLLLFTW